MRVAATGVWTPDGLLHDGAVELDADGTVTRVVPAKRGETKLEGLVIPALVNAHCHLELSHLHNQVPSTGKGFSEWVGRMMALRTDAVADVASAAAQVVEAGTGLLGDISNRPEPVVAGCEAAGLDTVVFHELVGFDKRVHADRIATAQTTGEARPGVLVRAAPHAPYSAPPALIQAAVKAGPPGGVPSSLHLAEDPTELEFLRSGTGQCADLLNRLQIDWQWWTPPGCSPVRYLAKLGVLGPELMLVHCVHTDGTDHREIAAAGASVVLCPRSNQWIGGQLPDVPSMLAAGVNLALGTDSLASNHDLDVLAEIPVLAKAFPDVPDDVWLHAATQGGADALRRPKRGRIAVGAQPGLVLLPGVLHPCQLAHNVPPRQWIARPPQETWA